MKRAARRDALAGLSRARLTDLHARVLTAFVAASPDDPGFEGDIGELRDDSESRARTLRDGIHDAIGLISAAEAPPVVGLALAVHVQRWETWAYNDATRAIAAASALARQRLLNGNAEAFRSLRDAGRAYDAVPVGLAWSAGARELALAVAFRDVDDLQAARTASALGVGPGEPDLPRTDIDALAGVADQTVIEIEGVVAETSFVSGGPAPQSVLTVAGEDDATVTVLVPFTSVDSVGIVDGVWAQIRGTLLHAGKDGLPGPVVQVRRIRGEEAARHSFADFLVSAGRHLFELRPGQLDLIAGRRAGDLTPLNEIKIRPGQPEADDE